MKVTAMIDDQLIHDAMKCSNAKTITEALKTALTEYVAIKNLKKLSAEIRNNPLAFKHSAKEIRSLNRN